MTGSSFDEWARGCSQIPCVRRWANRLAALGASWDSFRGRPNADIVKDLTELGGIPVLAAHDIVRIAKEEINQSMAPMAIFWDLENMPPPETKSGREVACRLKATLAPYGTLVQFRGYGSIGMNFIPQQKRSDLQLSGCHLVDCPHNGRKEVADKMIIVDAMKFAYENPEGATLCFVTTDVDYSYMIAALNRPKWRSVVISRGFNMTSMLHVNCDIKLQWETDVMQLPQAMLRHVHRTSTPRSINKESDQSLPEKVDASKTRESCGGFNNSYRRKSGGGAFDRSRANGNDPETSVQFAAEPRLILNDISQAAVASLNASSLAEERSLEKPADGEDAPTRVVIVGMESTLFLDEAARADEYKTLAAEEVAIGSQQSKLSSAEQIFNPLSFQIKDLPQISGVEGDPMTLQTYVEDWTKEDVTLLITIMEDNGNGPMNKIRKSRLGSLIAIANPTRFCRSGVTRAFLGWAIDEGLVVETGEGGFKELSLPKSGIDRSTPASHKSLFVSDDIPIEWWHLIPERLKAKAERLPFVMFVPKKRIPSGTEMPRNAYITRVTPNLLAVLFRSLEDAQQSLDELPQLFSCTLVDWRKCSLRDHQSFSDEMSLAMESEQATSDLSQRSSEEAAEEMNKKSMSCDFCSADLKDMDAIFVRKKRLAPGTSLESRTRKTACCENCYKWDGESEIQNAISFVVAFLELMAAHDEICITADCAKRLLCLRYPRECSTQKHGELWIEKAIESGKVATFSMRGSESRFVTLPVNFDIAKESILDDSVEAADNFDTLEHEEHIFNLLWRSETWLSKEMVVDSLRESFPFTMNHPLKRAKVFTNGQKNELFWIAQGPYGLTLGLSEEDADASLAMMTKEARMSNDIVRNERQSQPRNNSPPLIIAKKPKAKQNFGQPSFSTQIKVIGPELCDDSSSSLSEAILPSQNDDAVISQPEADDVDQHQVNHIVSASLVKVNDGTTCRESSANGSAGIFEGYLKYGDASTSEASKQPAPVGPKQSMSNFTPAAVEKGARYHNPLPAEEHDGFDEAAHPQSHRNQDNPKQTKEDSAAKTKETRVLRHPQNHPDSVKDVRSNPELISCDETTPDEDIQASTYLSGAEPVAGTPLTMAGTNISFKDSGQEENRQQTDRDDNNHSMSAMAPAVRAAAPPNHQTSLLSSSERRAPDCSLSSAIDQVDAGASLQASPEPQTYPTSDQQLSVIQGKMKVPGRYSVATTCYSCRKVLKETDIIHVMHSGTEEDETSCCMACYPWQGGDDERRDAVNRVVAIMTQLASYDDVYIGRPNLKKQLFLRHEDILSTRKHADLWIEEAVKSQEVVSFKRDGFHSSNKTKHLCLARYLTYCQSSKFPPDTLDTIREENHIRHYLSTEHDGSASRDLVIESLRRAYPGKMEDPFIRNKVFSNGHSNQKFYLAKGPFGQTVGLTEELAATALENLTQDARLSLQQGKKDEKSSSCCINKNSMDEDQHQTSAASTELSLLASGTRLVKAG